MHIKKNIIAELTFYIVLSAIFTYFFNGSSLSDLIYQPEYSDKATSLIWNVFFFTSIIFLAIGISRYLFGILLCLLLVTCVIFKYFEVNYNIPISVNFIASLLETNTGQSAAIFSSQLILYIIAAMVVSLLTTLLYFKIFSGEFSLLYNMTKLILKLTIIASVLMYSTTQDPFKFYPLNTYQSLKSYVEFRKEFVQKLSAKKNIANRKSEFNPDNDKLNIVLIIGESANPEHFQINGYAKATTPKLLNMSNVTSFGAMRSCRSTRTSSIACMLTSASEYNKKPENNEMSFIPLFNKHGFNSYWITHSDFYGQEETAISAFAREAKFRSFRSELQYSYKNANDSQILSVIKRLISGNGRNITIIHSRGSKAPYSKRHPAKYDIFNDDCANKNLQNCQHEKLINSYDNSIYYSDHFITQIIKQLKNKNALVFYSSDHGEALKQDATTAEKLNEQRHVPFLVWASDKFIEKNKTSAKQITQNSNQKLTHANIFHSILNCAGIKSKIINSRKSICGFMPRPHRKPSKAEIWLDTIKDDIKNIESGKYVGFRLPIQLISGQGIFLHNNQKNNSNLLSLQEFIIRQPEGQKYWFNFTNLNENNANEAAKFLNIIISGLDIAENIAIESTNIAPLAILKNTINDLAVIANLENYTEENKHFQQVIDDSLKEGKITNIAIAKELLTRKFVDKFLDYKIYSWYSQSDEELSELEKLGIDIVLTKPKEDDNASK